VSWIKAVARGLARSPATPPRPLISSICLDRLLICSQSVARQAWVCQSAAEEAGPLRLLTTFHGEQPRPSGQRVGPREPFRARLLWEPSQSGQLLSGVIQSCSLQKGCITQAPTAGTGPAPAALLSS